MELNSQLVWYTYNGQCILYHTTRPKLFGTKMIMFHEMTQRIASKSAIFLAYGNNEGSYNILKIRHILKPFTGPFGFRNVPNFENSYLQLQNLLQKILGFVYFDKWYKIDRNDKLSDFES